MKSLRAHWKAVVGCAVAFIIGGGVAASGASPAKTVVEHVTGQTRTVTMTAPAQTVVQYRTRIKTVVKVKHVYVHVKPQPATPTAPTASGHSYSGSGGTTIQVAVTRSGSVTWTNDGAIFQTWPAGSSLSTDFMVNSQAHSGSIFVPAGHYTLTVNAMGNWTIHTP